MKILPIEEYKKAEAEWSDKYNEYMSKLIEINVREDKELTAAGGQPAEVFEEMFDRFEAEIAELRKQYKDYTYPIVDFGCYLTLENITELLGPRLTNEIWKEDISNIGKVIAVNGVDGVITGVLTGVVCSLDDIYYEIQCTDGIEYASALGGYKLWDIN